MHTHKHVCTHAHMHTHTSTHAHMHTHKMHTTCTPHTQIYTHSLTHTHTPSYRFIATRGVWVNLTQDLWGRCIEEAQATGGHGGPRGPLRREKGSRQLQ